MKGIFVEIRDIQKIDGCSYSQAWRKMRTIKDIAGKNKITVREYCTIENITADDFNAGIKLADLKSIRVDLTSIKKI
jgi:hypothetical protein